MKKLIISLGLIVITISAFARHYARWVQTGNTYQPYTGTVQAYVDGRSVPEGTEQIGLIEYDARKNKSRTIEDAQKIAAEHGATSFYLPYKGGAVRTGIPYKGTFIAVRESTNLQNVSSTAQVTTNKEKESNNDQSFKVNDRVTFTSKKYKGKIIIGYIVALNSTMAIVEYDIRKHKIREDVMFSQLMRAE